MRPLSLLIVDDNENNLFTIKCLLEGQDSLEIHEASDGLEALEIIKNNKIDLALVDIQMPKMNGFELANSISELDLEEDIPLIFLTAYYKSEEFETRGYKLGAFDYITKPIDEARLLNKIGLYNRLHIKQEELKEANTLLTKTVQELKDTKHELKKLIKG